MKSTRLKRHKRLRSKISGTELRPRVSIYRSNKHIQIQAIDDESRRTILGLSSKTIKGDKLTKSDKSKELGKAFAAELKKLENGKYKSVVFDRGGHKYHGRIKAVAESLRENGLEF